MTPKIPATRPNKKGLATRGSAFDAPLLGVAVAVNKPVSVAVAEVLLVAVEVDVVEVIPGQSLEAAYQTPLIMTPWFFRMLLMESGGQLSFSALTKHVGLGLDGRLKEEVALAGPVVL